MAVVALDALVKDEKIGRFWYLTNINRDFKVVREIYYK